MILGLDVSTSITGVCVMDSSGKILLADHIDLKKFDDFYSKATRVKQYLSFVQNKYSTEKIIIEKSLQTFRSGFSSAKTLSTLASFNGLISWFCYDIFGIKPEHVSASTARKKMGIKSKKGENAKKLVFEEIAINRELINPEYTKFGNPKSYFYDICDAIVIANYGVQNE